MFSQDSTQAANVDANLANIKPLQFNVASRPSMPGVTTDFNLANQGESTSEESSTNDGSGLEQWLTRDAEAQGQAESESQGSDEQTEETGTQVSPGFAKEFKENFGIEPNEAIEVLNSLQVFRDEMKLMRDWGVTPTEYDQRITQVRDFYQSLPQDKQPEFNTAEGAKAIWNHLSKTQPQTAKKAAPKQTGRLMNTNQPKVDQVRKSEVLRMSKEEYRRNLPRIQKAVLENRFIED